ncbi:MAG: cysteine desulfurase [Candidatus Melainabacteria bacterium]|nr:cysteine desulfurase [Candidatus Melainabacteria bacterium]
MMKRIYLDNNATTGLDPRVLEAMLPELASTPNNPSSIHYFGQEAKIRLQKARETIAAFFKVKPHEVLFTSGGTESMNLLLRGLPCSGHAITSNVEHSCVYKTLLDLQKKGLEVEFLPAGLLGAVTADQIKKAIRPDTRFIALTAASNETGVKHDLDAIGQIALDVNIPLIVDGVAWLGKELFTLHPGISGIGFSGHKVHGPKGTGIAIVRSSLKLTPLLTGGDQEYSMRAGTENLPGILGLAKAIELLKTELPEAGHRMALLRDRLEAGLLQKVNPVVVNGMGPRICNTTNLSFPGDQGEDLLIALDMAGIAASHGSACSSGALEPSRVLTQMGVPAQIAKSAIRFSLSRTTTVEEIDRAIEIVSEIVTRLRKLS